MFPIGRGQRQLLLGDRYTGKKSIITCIALSQREFNRKYSLNNQNKGTLIIIYLGVGVTKRRVFEFKKSLSSKGGGFFTLILSSTASELSSFQYIAPFVATRYAEFIRDFGTDVLIFYDSLTNHAIAYRQMSLLVGKAPGREAYPGDIFYLHARLLERSAQMSKYFNYGSISCIPIVETAFGNISAYIPTNIISICDGQLYTNAETFRLGNRPAIDIYKSVSRIGSKAQTKIMSYLSSELRSQLRGYDKCLEILRQNRTLTKLERLQYSLGIASHRIILQDTYEIINYQDQIIMLLFLNSRSICIKSINNPSFIRILFNNKIWWFLLYILINKNSIITGKKLTEIFHIIINELYN